MSQRVRMSGSPGTTTKQGPLRATVPVAFMRQGSPTRSNKKTSPSNSPTIAWTQGDGNTTTSKGSKPRHSPDHRISPDRKSPGSPGLKDKSKTLTLKPLGSSPYIRRTASLDTIYLTGQWPKDVYSYCGRLMMDRATQTPDDWEEVERKKPSQKKPHATGDPFEMKFIRQRLQRTNQGGRSSSGHSPLPRHSPVHGDHLAISSTTSTIVTTTATTATINVTPTPPPSPSVFFPSSSPHPPMTPAPTSNNTGVPRTGPIPIPHIAKPLIPRMRSSVEGLNQEIERLVLKGNSGIENEAELERVLQPTPEGHRAPIAGLFHATCSVDTQTPSAISGDSNPNSSSESRSHSVSPVVNVFPESLETSQPASPDHGKSASPDDETTTKLGTSPQINKFLAREPPDGCEKVKIIEEARKPTSEDLSLELSILKPSVKFVLLPSQSSAFCPLVKNSLGGGNGTTPFPTLPNERLQ